MSEQTSCSALHCISLKRYNVDVSGTHHQMPQRDPPVLVRSFIYCQFRWPQTKTFLFKFCLCHRAELKRWDVENKKTKTKKKHGVEMLMWRGRNPVILTVDIKGDRPESSQFKTRTWVQSVLLLFSWPWPIITHRHSTGWITIRLGLEIGLLEAVLLYLTSFKLKYWRAWSSSK